MEDSASLGCLVTLDRKWSTDLLSNRSARAGGQCLVEEMAGKQSYLLWGKSWVEQGHQTCLQGESALSKAPVEGGICGALRKKDCRSGFRVQAVLLSKPFIRILETGV